MKRLWIRAHALPTIQELARTKGINQGRTKVLGSSDYGPNDMVVVEISDDLAASVARDGFLMASGRVLKDGEEPPYLGEEGKGKKGR